jgi:hypothetical protein
MTEAEYQLQLREALGGPQAIGPLAAALAWNRFAQFADLEERYDRALLSIIETFMGQTWEDMEVRTSAGQILHGEQAFEHLEAMYKLVSKRLTDRGAAVLLAYNSDESAPAVEEMTARYPIPTPTGVWPDPHSSRYKGDPLWYWREE